MLLRRKAQILMDKLYEDQITKIFNSWLKKYCNIDCFAILVILPDNNMLHLSTHPLLTQVYQERKYGLYDQPVSSLYYENLPLYPWKQPNQNKIQKEIHTIREKIFNLNSGTNVVRKIDSPSGTFHIIYCVSTYDPDPVNYFKFALNIDKIYEACDFCYNTLLPVFQENCNSFILPRINNFIGFNYNDLSKVFKSYTLQRDFAEKVISFLDKADIRSETEHKMRGTLRLVAMNAKRCNFARSNAFIPTVVE